MLKFKECKGGIMKKISIFLLLSIFSFCEERYFNLKEIIEYSIKNNPEIIINNKEIEKENINIEMERANKMPFFYFSGNGNRFKYPYPVIPISFEEGKLVIPEFDRTIFNYGFQFLFPLYKGSRIERGILLSEIKREIKKVNLKTGLEDLKYTLGNLYFEILKMEKRKKVKESSIEQMKAHKESAEIFYKAGSVPKIDLIKTEVELKRAEEDLLILNNNIEIYYEILKNLMGFEEDIKIRLKEEDFFKDFDFENMDLLKEAYLRRVEFKEIEEKKKLTEEKINYLKGKILPEVYLSSNYFLSSGSSFSFEDNWAVSLNLKFPLFEGGITKFEIKKEEIEREKIKEEERALKIKVEREIKEAILNLENSQKRIEVLKEAVEEAKENLRLEKILYEAGENTSKDVIDAENFFLQTEISLENAIFDKNISILNLYKAMGFDLLEILNKKEF